MRVAAARELKNRTGEVLPRVRAGEVGLARIREARLVSCDRREFGPPAAAQEITVVRVR
jgi:antitoxin (DNA-binding transcriptional repressor) of toxin-antitoxin stability system